MICAANRDPDDLIMARYVTENSRRVIESTLTSMEVKDPKNLTDEDIGMLSAQEEICRSCEDGENTLAPKSLECDADIIYPWLKSAFHDLYIVLYNNECVSVPSLDAEYLMVNLVYSYIENGICWGKDESYYKMDMPPEVVERMNEDILEEYKNNESELTLEDLAILFRNEYEDIRCWVDSGVAPESMLNTLLLWDRDFELLDEYPEEDLKKFDRISGMRLFD